MRAWLTMCLLVVPALAAGDPMRPLPRASSRPPEAGPGRYVDAARGDDAADGTSAKPWRTLQAAVAKLKPGDTLYLRGGVYFERVSLTTSGTAAAPITIRSAPGELAIVDGGLREFADAPRAAWEPLANHEYRSTATYPDIGPPGEPDRGVWVLGNFADAMVPLHGYRFDVDLRSDNPYWTVKNTEAGSGVYVGPGLWFDRRTHRIHARLAPTKLASLGVRGYRGGTDPRSMPLVIGTPRPAFALAGAKHVRLRDLVLRGSAGRTLAIEDAAHVELDGVTVYGGAPALFVKSTTQLRIVRSAFRGVAAPWSSRASMKYRGDQPYLVIASNKLPQSQDWEIAFCEFTDGHDGLVLDSIKTLRFHHNRVENFNDDALYLTYPPREAVPSDLHIYENVFARTYTALAFAEDHAARGKNAIGSGIYVFRNVFDLRVGTYNHIPKDAAADARPLELLAGRVVGDHGSPTWDPLYFYFNTVVTAGATWRGYYGALLGTMGTKGSIRRVFNNVFVQLDGDVGQSFKGSEGDDVQVDGNLSWTLRGSVVRGKNPFGGGRDVAIDPRLVDVTGGDFRLGAGSPAIDAGVALPASWPDTLRKADKGAPDLGALPSGTPMPRVGPAGLP